VIDKDIKKSGDIWVQPDEDNVVTRFFCVYVGNNVGGAMQNHTGQQAFKNEIEQCYQYYVSARG